MPRAILFGFEGGLVDLVGPRFEVLSAVLSEEGIELTDELLEAWPFGSPYEDWLESVIGRVRGGSQRALAPRLMARAAARYRSRFRDSGPAWLPGTHELVERAASAGVDLGVVTDLPRVEVTQALTGAGLAKYVKVVIGAEDHEEYDGRAAIYLLALNRLNTEPPLPERLIHPHEVVSIEGYVEGVSAAAAAGLLTVVIGSEAGRIEADYAFGSLTELDLSKLDSG